MRAARPGPVFALNIHADYECQRTGACCTAGWDVPVEPGVAAGVEQALADDRLRPAAPPAGSPSPLVRAPHPPEGATAVIARAASGACVFLERTDGHAACLVHRALGHDALPAACRHFPRIVLLDPRGVHVTLSHFCPTAAAMLVRGDADGLHRVQDPEAFVSRTGYEGFDATSTIPPLVRPGVAFDLESYSRWEAWMLEALGREHTSAEEGLAAIAHGAESLRRWTPSQGSLRQTVERLAADHRGGAPGRTAPHAPRVSPSRRATHAVRSFAAVAGRARPGLPAPAPPPDLDAAVRDFVEPAWDDMSPPVRRFLAAKAFAAWSAYQGEGVRTSVAVLGLALDVLVVECARQAGAAGRILDVPLLTAAVRQADLLLEHLVDRADLVRLAAPAEALDSQQFLDAVSLAAS